MNTLMLPLLSRRVREAASRWRFVALLPALVVLSPCGTAADAAAAASAPPIAAPLSRPAAVIDAGKAQMVMLDRMVDGFAAEGTSVTAWLAHGQVAKIEVVALGERGRTLYDFWWHGPTLLAARERRIDYGQPITALPKDLPTPMNVVLDDVIDYRGGTASRWAHDGRPQPAAGREAAARARELAGRARTFRRLMTTPAPRGGAACDWQCATAWGAECARFHCR